MNAKILDSTQFYKFDFHKKIVTRTQKNLPLQAFATSTLRNSIGRRALVDLLSVIGTKFQIRGAVLFVFIQIKKLAQYIF